MKRFLSLFLALMLVLTVPFTAQAERKWSKFYNHGSRDEARIAITIDDWWHPEMLPDFLDVAKEYGVQLTLYPSGCNLHAEDRELWQRALDEGHEIGSHGFTHMDFSTRGYLNIQRDLEKYQTALDETLGYHYEFLTVRVPYGKGRAGENSRSLKSALHRAGFDHVIFWDMDNTKDLKKALKSIQNGSIVLMHGNNSDLKFFRELMEALKDRNYEYVTVSDLLGITTRLITEDEET